MSDKKFIDVFNRALEAGLAGSGAMIVNVITLMWIRTVINYQYRYGLSTSEAFRALYNDGGFLRFYRGLVPALLQGFISKISSF